MATIRAYTTIEQSRKLAEILPLESADMFYTSLNSEYHWIWIDKHLMEAEYIPCWSLAALLELMPKLHKLQHSEEGYYCSLANYKCVTESYNNPIDACYEMIIKLNELNLL